ncbi:MAG: xanthine dehydrogenase family protein molybdopterin-binding subunit [Acidimicrobiales bacterium]
MVGAPVPRREAPAKVTARPATARTSTSPVSWKRRSCAAHPHARVRSVDVRAALAVPGVVDVLTPADTATVRWYQEGVPLLGSTVRFVGDEVAAVAATSARAARAGAAAVRVDYEPLPHVTDFEAALDPDAPAVHPGGNRTKAPKVQGRGDVDAALATAEVVVERTYRTPTAVHNAFEPHGCVASWSGGELTLHASTQGVNDVRSMIADALGLAHSRVRVIAEHIGGGFGAKQIPWKDVAIAALLSQRCLRPVRCLYDRRGENLAAGKRGATRQRVRLGARRDGTLVAIDAELLGDSGAYRTGGESAALWGPYLSLYRCPAVRTTTTFVYTNTGPAVAFRAPGFVESIFALESAMDELADRVGVDPIELRRRNHTDVDQEAGRPLSSPTALPAAYDRIVEVAGWVPRPLVPPDHTEGAPDRRADPAITREQTVRYGRGFAAHDWVGGGASPPGFADVELHEDGSAEVRTTTQDIGTGTRTLLAQVAAEQLGLDPDEIRIGLGDTAAGPPAPTSSGSATAPTMAPAVRAAAAEARHRLLAAAADRLGCRADELHLSAGEIAAGDGRRCSVAEVLAGIGPEGVRGRGATLGQPDGVTVRTSGAAVADVEVDVATGEVRVTRIVVAPDCGRIINPRLVESQIIGGVAQGIGFALTESQLTDGRLGTVVNASLEDYLVPTVADTCAVHHAVVGVADEAANPLGVKGIGELPMIAVPAAIANAVSDAIGVRITELPITRRRVLDAVALAGRAARSRPQPARPQPAQQQPAQAPADTAQETTERPR